MRFASSSWTFNGVQRTMHCAHVFEEQVKVIGDNDVIPHPLHVFLSDSRQGVPDGQEAWVGAKQCVHYELVDRLYHQIFVDTKESVIGLRARLKPVADGIPVF